MLVAKATENQQLYMKFSHENVYKISELQTILNADVKRHILVAHVFTGCDTVSSLFNRGKKKIITLHAHEAFMRFRISRFL